METNENIWEPFHFINQGNGLLCTMLEKKALQMFDYFFLTQNGQF